MRVWQEKILLQGLARQRKSWVIRQEESMIYGSGTQQCLGHEWRRAGGIKAMQHPAKTLSPRSPQVCSWRRRRLGHGAMRWVVLLVCLVFGGSLVGEGESWAKQPASSAPAAKAPPVLTPPPASSYVRIGVITSRTGRFASPSKPMFQALGLTAQRIDDSGGVRLRDRKVGVELVFVDDHSTVEAAKQQAAALAKDPEVMAIIAPYSSDMVLAVRDEAEKVGIPVLNAVGAAPTLHRVREEPWMFGIGSAANGYFAPVLEAAARRVAAGKNIRVAVAYQDDLFGRSIGEWTEQELKRTGIPLSFTQVLSRSADLPLLFAALEREQPNLLIFSANDAEMTRGFVSGLAEKQINLDMLGVSGCRAAGLEKLGTPAEYVLCPVQWDGLANYQDPYWENATQFLSAFEVAFGAEPTYQAAQAAASLVVITKALESAGTLDRALLRRALAETDLNTLFGPVRFGPDGRNSAVRPLLEQVRGGRYMTVLPPERAWVPLVARMPVWKDRLP